MAYPFIKLTDIVSKRPLIAKVRETKIPTPIIAVIDKTMPEEGTVTHVWIGDGVLKVAENYGTIVARMEAELGETLFAPSSEATTFLEQANTKRIK